MHATRWFGQHPDLDGRTRTDLERTVRQAFDRGLDGSESDADVQTRVADKARRETVRRELIEHGAEYVAQELAQEEDLTPGERASPERDVKRALEEDITGTESERDVEALVDDVLDDMVGGTEDDGRR